MKRKSSNTVAVEFYGSAELLRAIESAGASAENAAREALERSAHTVGAKLKAYVATSGNLPAQGKFSKGKTLASYQEEATLKGDRLRVKVGFDQSSDNLGATFLERGTPYHAPTRFIGNIADASADEIKREQEQVLQQAFKRALGS